MKSISCFVIMPSNESEKVRLFRDPQRGWVRLPIGVGANNSVEIDFDEIYNHIIVGAIEQTEKESERPITIEYTRGENIAGSGSIIRQVLKQICEADITIADITTANPNVFLEVGIRLAIRDPYNIIMTYGGEGEQNNFVLPFDIQDIRCIGYGRSLTRAETARTEIKNSLLAFLQRKSDARVAEAGFRQFVDLYTGRKAERDLARLLRKPDSDALASLSILVTRLIEACYAEPVREAKSDDEADLRKVADELGRALDPISDAAKQFYQLLVKIPSLPIPVRVDALNHLVDLHSSRGDKKGMSKYDRDLKELWEKFNGGTK